MADEDEDKGWLKPSGGSPFRHGPSPMRYNSYRSGSVSYSAFKTETLRVPAEQAQSKFDDYMRQYPAAGYATELLKQTPNADGTITLVFQRYPTAE